MRLSKRLQTVAGAVTPGHRVADIGTDHGYVPIYLIKEKISPKALALDVKPGPLSRAADHIEEEGLTAFVETRLSDGLQKLDPAEADTIILAGMGGDLICRILGDALAFLAAGKELVLQPQSEWFKVRHFLYDQSYHIDQEWFLCEGGKYYIVIRALPGREDDQHLTDVSEREDDQHLTDGSGRAEVQNIIYESGTEGDLNVRDGSNLDLYFRYGRHLIERRDPVFFEYLQKEYEKKRNILIEMNRYAGKDGDRGPGLQKKGPVRHRYLALKKETADLNQILRLWK